MKKRNKNRTIVRIMVFLALVLITTSTQAARSVQEMMKNEVTDVSSLQTFYTKHNSSYERRYFLQYLPVYLEKYEVSETPGWVITALNDALKSNDAPLSISAVKTIGMLKLESFSDELTQGFINSGQKAHLALTYRIAVLESLKKFDRSDEMKNNVSVLLQNFPEWRIRDSDFAGLMEIAVRFGVKENALLFEKFETHVDNLLNSHEPDEKRRRELNEIKEMIQRTKSSLSLKGGQNE